MLHAPFTAVESKSKAACLEDGYYNVKSRIRVRSGSGATLAISWFKNIWNSALRLRLHIMILAMQN